MSVEELKALRKATGMSQRNFANSMGVPLRTLENLEMGVSEVRPVHLNAARWAVLTEMANDQSGLISPPEEIVQVAWKAISARNRSQL